MAGCYDLHMRSILRMSDAEEGERMWLCERLDVKADLSDDGELRVAKSLGK